MKQLNAKKYTLLALSAILLYVLYNFSIYTLYTSKIFDRKDGKYIGDIARVGYQVDALFPRKLQYTLPKRHLFKEAYSEKLPIDVLTIGDSFSNAATGGLNPHYQDYIASYYNKSVLNIVDTRGDRLHMFEPIIALYHKGWFQKHKVKYVIIQSVERFCVMRFAKSFDFNTTTIDIKKDIRSPRSKDSFIPPISFISTANYKYLYYTIRSSKKVHFHIDVDKLQLNKKLFTPKNFQDKLLIHHEDILSIPYNTKQNIQKLNANFNRLAVMLKKEGITLIFMPTVDKYDLYYPYIKNNPYPKNYFFDYLRVLPKEYSFIDTKKILEPLLQQGVKNLYYPDDTHWSYKAIDAIMRSDRFKKIFMDR
jgi:hypothetical protein